MSSKAGPVLRYVLVDLVGSVVQFPVWWYTSGFLDVARWARRSLGFQWRKYALRLWLRFFFVPMYGQHDLTGRLVSVLMRFVILIARVVMLFAFSIGYGIFLLIWLLAPIAFAVLFLDSLSRTMIRAPLP